LPETFGYTKNPDSGLVEVKAQLLPRSRTASKLLTYVPGLEDVARIYGLRMGARIPDDILKIARKERIATGRVEAIGGVNRLKLAYYNSREKKYEEHEYSGSFEVTSLLGNITTKDGNPFLHAHGTFGRRDMGVVGGHVMTATVSPILEVIITPTKNRALRRFDETMGLNVIYKIS